MPPRPASVAPSPRATRRSSPRGAHPVAAVTPRSANAVAARHGEVAAGHGQAVAQGPANAVARGHANPVAAVALAGASGVAAAGVGSLFLSTATDAWIAIAAAGPAGPADGILLVVGVLGTLLSLWLGLGLSLSALAALPGALGQTSSLLAVRVAPAAARKAVAFVLGTTLTAALVPGTAVASTGHPASRPASFAMSQIAFGHLHDAAPDASFRLVREATSESDARSARDAVSSRDATSARDAVSVKVATLATDAAPPPTWTPDRSSSPRGESHSGSVSVRRGDTLWSIAAHRLGATATSTDIDAEWHRWFAANRKVIGDDADAIEPGQLLNPPTSTPVRS